MIHFGIFFQCLPFNVFHHHVIQFTIQHRVEYFHDVWMRQFSCQGSFGKQQLAVRIGAHRIAQRIWIKQLECNLLVVELIQCQVHRAGRTAPQLPDNFIFADAFHKLKAAYPLRTRLAMDD